MSKRRDRPVVLVTGCSTGIGRAAVVHLARADCLVVATARNRDSIADLRQEGRVDTLRLDVTDEASRTHAVGETLARHGRIDALVNNAGYGASLAIEDTPLPLMRAMFETNVFGAMRLVQLVLPAMRAQRSGRIVNVSSIAGHATVPMLGAYSATKFALRALSTSLRGEVRPYGIRVSLVEPGLIRTEFSNRSRSEKQAALPDTSVSAYAPLYGRWRKYRGSRGAPPEVIARRIVHACTARRPRFHYFAPWDAKTANLAKRLLPDAVLNHAAARAFRFTPVDGPADRARAEPERANPPPPS